MAGIKKDTVGSIVKSVSISPEFFNLVKQYGLSLSEATRIGISVQLSELGVSKYANSVNLYRKMLGFKEKTEELMQELDRIHAQREA
jgi:hypothetical protein